MKLDLNNPEQVIETVREFVATTRESQKYRAAIRNIKLARAYREGDQIPEGFKHEKHFPVVVLSHLSQDIERLVGMVVAGKEDVRFYGRDSRTKDMLSIIAAENESWRYYVGFKNKMGQVAHRLFDCGYAVTKLSVDPTRRVGQNLPHIPLEVPPSQAALIDPLASDPADPILGGRYVSLYAAKSVAQLRSEYGSRTAFRKSFARITKLEDKAEQDNFVQHFDLDLHPLEQQLMALINKSAEQTSDDPNMRKGEKTEHSKLLLVNYTLWREWLDFVTDNGPETRQAWVMATTVADLKDVELKDAILVDVQVLDYDENPTIQLACTDPPYGQPLAIMLKGSIDARNMVNSAILALVAQLIRMGRKQGVIGDIMDPKQLADLKERGKEADITLFSAEKMREFGLGDVRQVITNLSANFPNLAPVVEYAQQLKREHEEIAGTPWVVQGQASPSSRFSGAAIGMMQQAVMLGKNIIGNFLAQAATNQIKAAFAMQQKHWTSPHRIMQKGITDMRVNQIVVNPDIANMMLNRDFSINGQPMKLTGVRADIRSHGGGPVIQTYPLSPQTKDVLRDELLDWLLSRSDIERIMWIANGIAQTNVDIEVLVEADSVEKDQERFAQLQAIMGISPELLAPQVQYEMAMGSNSEHTWEENQALKAGDEAIAELMNLPPDVLHRILQIVRQPQPQQGQPQPQAIQAAPPAQQAVA